MVPCQLRQDKKWHALCQIFLIFFDFLGSNFRKLQSFATKFESDAMINIRLLNSRHMLFSFFFLCRGTAKLYIYVYVRQLRFKICNIMLLNMIVDSNRG